MNPGIKAKSIFARIADVAGRIDKSFAEKARSHYVILMYHRVIPYKNAGPGLQAGMYVEPDTFEMHIKYLAQHFRVVPFPDKPFALRNEEISRSNRPACILTFDDGWRDIFDFAYPVLKMHQAPATVFLPTGYIGTDDWFWTDRLAKCLSAGSFPAKSAFPGIQQNKPLLDKIVGLKGTFGKRLETAITMLKMRNHREIEEVVSGLEERLESGPGPDGRVFLNWEEVREMKRSGYVSFGSHTHTHRILVHLKEEEVLDELTLSKSALLREGAADPAFVPFCYPNGSWNHRIASLVREAGYHAAVSTGNGWNEAGVSPFELNRIAIHQDMTASREMFGCRVAEIL